MQADRSSSRRCAGFTLVEAACAIAVLAVISVVSSRLILDASDQYLSAVSRSEIAGSASSALERLVTEIRQIPAVQGASAIEPSLTSLSPTSINWNDSNGSARGVSLSGTTLTLIEGSSQHTLLRDVTAFSVAAFDQSGGALAASLGTGQTAAVRRISLTISLTRAGETETLRTRVFLRCMIEGGGV